MTEAEMDGIRASATAMNAEAMRWLDETRPGWRQATADARCQGCGYTKYGHHMAIEHMVATAHGWRPARPNPPKETGGAQ